LNVKECAEKIGLTKYAVYKMIREGRGIGQHFKYKPGAGWTIDGRLVKKVK